MTPGEKSAIYERAEGICLAIEADRAANAPVGSHPVNTGSRIAWLTPAEYERFKHEMRRPDPTGAVPRAPNRHERRAMKARQQR
jgi:hypothetical protein